jgi:hypothetical protein
MASSGVRSDHIPVTIRFLLSVLLACYTISTSAQQSLHPIFTHVDSAEVWFNKIVGPENVAIINGPVYHISFKGFKTHPFYQSAESDRTLLRYDNDLYTNIDLQYDTYKDILVLKRVTPTGVFLIELNSHLVQHFDLHGHHFKKYDEGIRAGIGPYFDVLFEENEFAVVAKRHKSERVNETTTDYLEDDVYYILSRGDWIKITSKSSFTKLLNKDQGKEMTAFIKSNRINVRKRKDEDLRKLGAFCYSLKERK